MTTKDFKQLEKLLDERFAPIQKTLDSHTKYLKSLKKTQSVMLVSLDGEQMDQRKRLERLEEHARL